MFQLYVNYYYCYFYLDRKIKVSVNFKLFFISNQKCFKIIVKQILSPFKQCSFLLFCAKNLIESLSARGTRPLFIHKNKQRYWPKFAAFHIYLRHEIHTENCSVFSKTSKVYWTFKCNVMHTKVIQKICGHIWQLLFHFK